jgi:hypothetical protein
MHCKCDFLITYLWNRWRATIILHSLSSRGTARRLWTVNQAMKTRSEKWALLDYSSTAHYLAKAAAAMLHLTRVFLHKRVVDDDGCCSVRKTWPSPGRQTTQKNWEERKLLLSATLFSLEKQLLFYLHYIVVFPKGLYFNRLEVFLVIFDDFLMSDPINLGSDF